MANGTDAVTLSGNATNVLHSLVRSPADPHDQSEHRRSRSRRSVNTSLADTLQPHGPTPRQGWTVAIDSSGNVTVTPAAGLQGGTYPIQLIAQSSTDPNLIAQTHGERDHHAHAAGNDAGS